MRCAWLLMLVVLLIAACDNKADVDSQSANAQPESDWVKDEILEQLAELRQEVRALKKTVEQIDARLQSTKVVANSRLQQKVPEQVRFGNHPVLGNEKASIAIVEFSDYQCPFCKRHHQQVLPRLKKSFIENGLVQYVVRDFPLRSHDQAYPAAIAASCAQEQGQYWTMHDVLFDNQMVLADGIYTQLARQLSMVINTFDTCMADTRHTLAIDKDVTDGNSLGVTGTPRFFVGRVNGDVMTDITVISGAQSYEIFAAAIRELN